MTFVGTEPNKLTALLDRVETNLSTRAHNAIDTVTSHIPEKVKPAVATALALAALAIPYGLFQQEQRNGDNARLVTAGKMAGSETALAAKTLFDALGIELSTLRVQGFTKPGAVINSASSAQIEKKDAAAFAVLCKDHDLPANSSWTATPAAICTKLAAGAPLTITDVRIAADDIAFADLARLSTIAKEPEAAKRRHEQLAAFKNQLSANAGSIFHKPSFSTLNRR